MPTRTLTLAALALLGMAQPADAQYQRRYEEPYVSPWSYYRAPEFPQPQPPMQYPIIPPAGQSTGPARTAPMVDWGSVYRPSDRDRCLAYRDCR